MNHLGQEQTIKANDQTFRLSRFSRRLLRLWFEWSDSYLESPLAIVEEHFKTFPYPGRLVGVGETIAQQRYSFTDEAVWNLWQTELGIRQSFQLLFQKYHADVDANPIADVLGMSKVETLIARANGIPPTNPYEIEKRYFIEIGLMEPDARATPISCKWEEFDRSLFQNLHLVPSQIDELTPTEISVLTAKEDSGLDLESAIAFGKLQSLLTPEQQLHLARIKYRS